MLKDRESNSFKSLDVEFRGNVTVKYPLFGFVINLFLSFKQGILPYPGALADQPAKIIEIFDVLDRLQHEAQVKAQKKQEKEAKRRGKS